MRWDLALLMGIVAGCGYGPARTCDRLTTADVDALGDPGLPIRTSMVLTSAEAMLSLKASAEHPEKLPFIEAEGIEAWTLAPALDVVCPDRTVASAVCGDGEVTVTLAAAPEGCDDVGDAWVLVRHRPDAVGSVVVLTSDEPATDTDAAETDASAP